MKFRTSVLLLCVVVAVAAFFAGFLMARTEGVAAAQDQRGPVASPPGAPVPPPVPPVPGRNLAPTMMRPPMRSFGPVAISATGNYVYVIYDGTLYQFQADGLKIVKKTPLYEEEAAPK